MPWILSAFADEAADAIDEQVKALTDADLHFIDPRGVAGHNIAALPFDLARQFKDTLDAANISVNMLGSPIGKIDIGDDFQGDLDKLDHLAEVGKILDCNRVRIFSYYNKADLPTDRWQQISLDRLGQLKARAGDLGLKLYHENEHAIFGETRQRVKIIADALHDGDTFCLIFDFDNFHQVGDDCWAAWLALRDRTDTIHLKDSDENKQHVPVGQGAGQVGKILRDALARNWSGPLSLEPHLAHSPAVMATGPSGDANAALTDMTPPECFAIAAEAAHTLLREINADVQ